MVIMAYPPISGGRRLKPLLYTLKEGTFLYRIFTPEYNPTALTFRYWGPLSRFDHHRCNNMPDYCYEKRTCEPAYDSERGICYVAPTLSSSLVEVFGDIGVVQITDHRIGLITPKRDLTLLDVRDRGAMLAGANEATLSKIPNRLISQAWSRYFYEQPGIYTEIYGIIYGNAHNDEDAIAIYERADKYLVIQEELSLKYKGLRSSVLKAAVANHLILEPYKTVDSLE